MRILETVGKERIWISVIIVLQAICALVFVWELAVSVLGLPFGLLPWGIYEIVEIGAAIGLLLGIGLSAYSLRRTHERADRAEKKLEAASREFLELMDERFTDWHLTPAERDVALFAIKGMTTAEIASLRNTSEGTVKAQTAAIYRKAGVSGRPQLLSLFIEDLLDDSFTPPFRQAAE